MMMWHGEKKKKIIILPIPLLYIFFVKLNCCGRLETDGMYRLWLLGIYLVSCLVTEVFFGKEKKYLHALIYYMLHSMRPE